MKFDNRTQGPGLVRQRVAVGATALAMGVTAVFGSGLMAAAHADAATASGVILGVGANETQRVVSWYSSTGTAQVVQVVPTSKLGKDEFAKHTVTFPATVTANSV